MVDIQIILTCDCRYCSSRTFAAEAVEELQAQSEETIDITAILNSAMSSGTPASLNRADPANLP